MELNANEHHYTCILPSITPVFCPALHQYFGLHYSSPLEGVPKYSRMSIVVRSREYYYNVSFSFLGNKRILQTYR